MHKNLNFISTPYKHLFFIIANVLSLSRDLPHPFLIVYLNPDLHHLLNDTFYADQIFIDPTFLDICVCGPLQSLEVNVCNFMNFRP